MEVEVGGDEVGLWVFRRVLNGGKVVNLIIRGNNDHSSGVLTCGSLNASAAQCEPVFLSL